MPFGPFGLGMPELLILGGLIVLLFGAKKIPEFFGSLGKGIKEFKKAMQEEESPSRREGGESPAAEGKRQTSD